MKPDPSIKGKKTMEQQIMDLVEKNKEYQELIERIIAYEEEKEEEWRASESTICGFEWEDVAGPPAMLTQLLLRGILKCVYKSRSSKIYRLKDKETVKKTLELISQPSVEIEQKKEIPEDLFDVVIGYDQVKSLFYKSLKSEKPVHILMEGGPATAKSLFLLCLSRLPGSTFCLGSTATKAGLTELLLNERPRYVILDEIEKISNPQDTATLLSVMETGIVTETKFRRHGRKKLNMRVFASANRIDRMPPELLSRFVKLKFSDYTDEEFYDVAKNVLIKREGIHEELADYITKEVRKKLNSLDVRDAVKVSRLCKTKEEVDGVLESLLKYR